MKSWSQKIDCSCWTNTKGVFAHCQPVLLNIKKTLSQNKPSPKNDKEFRRWECLSPQLLRNFTCHLPLVTLNCSSRPLLMITFHMQLLMNLHILPKFSWQSQTTLCSIIVNLFFFFLNLCIFILIIYLFDFVFSRTMFQRESVLLSFYNEQTQRWCLHIY